MHSGKPCTDGVIRVVLGNNLEVIKCIISTILFYQTYPKHIHTNILIMISVEQVPRNEMLYSLTGKT